MKYLDAYLNKIIDSGNVQLAESIKKTAEDLGNDHIKNFSFISHEIGLLFGNIQSGKTGQMFGILCKAADLGFPAFIILTTDSVVLQQQTLKRVQDDLQGFCICGENDSGKFIDNRLETPTIVVLKKNARILRLWANVFNTTGFMKGNPLFIIDDEADAASLNTLVNKKRQSSINQYLDSIKNGASSSLYLQVTATPQSIYLQTERSGWRPLFTYYFRPGQGYLGGDLFFPKNNEPKCITFIDDLQHPDRDVVIRHLAVSSQLLCSGETVSNCLVHPSSRQAVHERFASNIQKELDWCLANTDNDFASELKRHHDAFEPANSEKVPFDKLFNFTKKILRDHKYKVLIMNGTTEIESDEYSAGCNFIIGGNTLSRGVTFPKLETLYYTRTAKKPQADTMWQHSRMFGYDRDPGMAMVFIDEQLYKLFSDINATNNAIIAQVEEGFDNVKIYYPEGLNPTRKNVLDTESVIAISGGTNYYPFHPDNDSIESLSKLLEPFSDDEPYYQVSLRIMKEIFTHIIPSPDFKQASFNSILDTMLSEAPTAQGILIVRRGRDVAQGTGALLSPNDWKLGGSFPRKVVLTMYQVTGNKGWNNQPLWIPNIKLPEGSIYYDIIDD